MQVQFTPAESAILRNIPEPDLVGLAAELDIAVPEQIEREPLVARIILNLDLLARREGLPLSDYDEDDLAALDPTHMRALAELCGAQPSVAGLLKAGRKVYKSYLKHRPHSPIAMLLPTLLAPLARYAYEPWDPTSPA